MAEERDINNLVTLSAGEDEARTAAFAALETCVKSNANQVNVLTNAINFNTDWEPPFKALKVWSKEHPEVELILLADAFGHRHWICKSVFKAGKSSDMVLSLIDDEFEAVFEEIYGMPHADWEKAPTEPFANYLQA
ncbi:MAG: hypothetical protein AAGA45_06265 [Verrucomicrobiota bacterium]